MGTEAQPAAGTPLFARMRALWSYASKSFFEWKHRALVAILSVSLRFPFAHHSLHLARLLSLGSVRLERARVLWLYSLSPGKLTLRQNCHGMIQAPLRVGELPRSEVVELPAIKAF